MKNATRNSWAIIGVIPVVIISLIIIRIESRAERCYGLTDAFLFVITYGALIIALSIGGIIQLVKLMKGKEIGIRVINLLLMLGFAGLAFWFSKMEDDYFQEPSILKAELVESLDIGKIILRENKKYSVQFGHIDWSCTRIGEYEIKGDTLLLGDRIANESNKIISSRYLIQNDKYLMPIDTGMKSTDSTHWLRINEIKNEGWR